MGSQNTLCFQSKTFVILAWKCCDYCCLKKKYGELIVLELQRIITHSRICLGNCLYRPSETRKYLRHDRRFTDRNANPLQIPECHAVMPPHIATFSDLHCSPNDHQEFLLNPKIFLLIMLHDFIFKAILEGETNFSNLIPCKFVLIAQSKNVALVCSLAL